MITASEEQEDEIQKRVKRGIPTDPENHVIPVMIVLQAILRLESSSFNHPAGTG